MTFTGIPIQDGGQDLDDRFDPRGHDEKNRISELNDRLLSERQHIAEVLAAFYAAPVTISSLQPILALCVELNPALKAKS